MRRKHAAAPIDRPTLMCCASALALSAAACAPSSWLRIRLTPTSASFIRWWSRVSLGEVHEGRGKQGPAATTYLSRLSLRASRASFSAASASCRASCSRSSSLASSSARPSSRSATRASSSRDRDSAAARARASA